MIISQSLEPNIKSELRTKHQRMKEDLDNWSNTKEQVQIWRSPMLGSELGESQHTSVRKGKSDLKPFF